MRIDGFRLLLLCLLALVLVACDSGSGDGGGGGDDVSAADVQQDSGVASPDSAEPDSAEPDAAGPDAVGQDTAGDDVELPCAEGDPCDDQNACTENDRCDAEGLCVGEALTCDDGDACNGVETCAPETGCVAGEALVCDDGDACNGVETCDAADGCVAGKALVCDDGDACNGVETCDATDGCVAGEALVCDDGDACNGVETCDATDGCVAGEALVCDDGDACNGVETCDAADGCVAGEALVCDDGDACNGAETCDTASGCVAGEALVCDDGNACNGAETCDAASGCVAGEALVCDDGDACNGVEICDAASGCVAGEALVCDDGNACNGEELCDANTGCVDGTPLSCDDGDVCNGVETCDAASGCVAGEALACDDGNPCNGVELCDASAGCVPGTPVTCDDGNACNGREICDIDDGTCVAGTPLTCDDGDPCTQDSCDPTDGCVYQPGDGACDDGNPCTLDDTCTAAGCVGRDACPDGGACVVGCDGTFQQWCVGGQIQENDCAAYGSTCGEVEPGVFDCVCDVETYEAACADEANMSYCAQDGSVELFDCGSGNAACGELDGDVTCTCDPDNHAPVCLDGHRRALCDEGGFAVAEDCSSLGGVCSDRPEVGGTCVCGADFEPRCLDDGTYWSFCGEDDEIWFLSCEYFGGGCVERQGGGTGCGCDPATYMGDCLDDGTALVCTPDGVVEMVDCAADGTTCGTGDDGGMTCVGGGCPDVPDTGLCQGDVLVTCEDGFERTTDCGASGLVCNFDTASGMNACVAPATGCGGIDDIGTCQGDTAVWCEGDELRSFDCGSYGATCGDIAALGFYWCACDDTFESACYGEGIALVCSDDGFVATQNCADAGMACGQNDFGENVCLGSGCDGETFLGRCDGTSVIWCENENVWQQDCAERGETCAYDLDNHYVGCAAEAPDCSAVAVENQCAGDVLEYCADGTMAAGLDCAEFDLTCGWSDYYQSNQCLGCQGVPAAGICHEGDLYWCHEEETLLSSDCDGFGATCADIGEGTMACACSPDSYAPQCAGDTLVFCDSAWNVLQTEDCAAAGGSCGAGAGGVAACIGGGCGDETFEGRCDGQTLVYCENETVFSADCGEHGYVCAYEEERGIYNCLADTGDCGAETAAGRCDGDTFIQCAVVGGAHQVVSTDCAATGRVCGEGDGGALGCVDPPPGCGAETYEGRCDGETLIYCADEFVQTIDCAANGMVCGEHAEHAGIMDCVQPTAGNCGDVTYFGACDGDVLTFCSADVPRSIDCAAGDLVCGDDGLTGMNCIPPETAGACDPACGPGFFCASGMCRADGTQEREWTYMVYKAADNNLAAMALWDLEEMEAIGSTGDVAVVVQAEFQAGDLTPPEIVGDTYRYLVSYHPEWPPDYAAMQAGALGDQNMGDPATVSEFIRWSVDRYPAKHYALVFWNHGGGWMGGFQDETAGDDLTLEEIRSGIRDAGVHIDVIDFDACLMGMYEVATELYDVADYVVASEEIEPGCGNAYDLFLDDLTANPEMGGRDLAVAVVDAYVEFYSSPDCPEGCALDVTKSALDLARAIPFHEQVSRLANALRADIREHRAEILQIVSGTQEFYYSFYRDVRHLADLVAASGLSGEARSAASALAAAMRLEEGGYVVANGVYRQPGSTGLANVGGVSVFAPDLEDMATNAHLLERYADELTFRQRRSAWSLFVQELVADAVADTLVAMDGSVTLSWFVDAGYTVPSDANLTLWVLEPDNRLYSAQSGLTTPNANFSPESSVAGVSVESYEFRDRVQPGDYLFFVTYDADGADHSSAGARFVFERPGVSGYPVDLTRVDGYGNELPMSLATPLADPIGRIYAGDLTDEEIQRMWSNGYSNIWMINPFTVE